MRHGCSDAGEQVSIQAHVTLAYVRQIAPYSMPRSGAVLGSSRAAPSSIVSWMTS